MKRSEINSLLRAASRCYEAHGWALPPNPRWDITDFGLRDWRRYGLVLVNLAEEPEYCEKLMYAQKRDDNSSTCPCQEEGGYYLPLGQVGGAGLGGQASSARE
jgi:D-lyxose ketol-isomerase